MTIEQTKPRSAYTIATTGPYALRDSGGNPWPYVAGGVLASVIKDGQITDLVAGTEFTVAPASGTDGNLTLSAGALAAHTGGQLIITRQTPQEQAWQAVQGPREVGLAAQLDRAMMIIQEQQVALESTLRLPANVLPNAVLTSGHLVQFGASGFEDGPMPGDIASAAENAQIATDKAGEASDSADAAAAMLSAAGLPASPVANTFLQRNAGNTGYVGRTFAEVRTDLGISGIGGDTSTTITNADTQTVGGFFNIAAGSIGNPLGVDAILHHIPADTNAGRRQIIYAKGSSEVRYRARAGLIWMPWEEIPRIGTAAGTVATLGAGGELAAARIPLSVGARLIRTANIPSAVAAVDFTSADMDTAKYSDFIVVFRNMLPVSTPARLWVRTSADGGVSFEAGASSYVFALTGVNSSSNAGDVGGTANAFRLSFADTHQTNNGGISGQFEIYGCDLARRQKTTWSNSHWRTDSLLETNSGGGIRLTDDVTNGLRIMFSTGNIAGNANSSISLYGVAK